MLHRQVQKLMEDRQRMAAGAMPINWGFAESMAYALLDEAPVHTTGQDCGVGTFFCRHAALHDQKTDGRYIPLNKLAQWPTFDLYDSLLSEEAVLAVRLRHAQCPGDLERFGDFANGAGGDRSVHCFRGT